MQKAFTMLELVFVIVVVGILAVIAIPRIKTSGVHEAAVQLVSHIRYTQHLAMIDDKYNANDPDWEKGRWQMVFTKNSIFADNQLSYTIFSDKDFGKGYGGDAVSTEIAISPNNSNKIMTGGYGHTVLDIRDSKFIGMKEMNLGISYGVTKITSSGGCPKLFHLTFDNFGRPIQGTHSAKTNTHKLIKENCILTLTDGTETVIITIRPETGFASIN